MAGLFDKSEKNICKWLDDPLFAGMETWQDLSGYEEFINIAYQQSDTRKKSIEALRAKFLTPRYIARIVGLSGIGKTRFIVETFRPDDSAEISPQNILSNNTVYVDFKWMQWSQLICMIQVLRRRDNETVLVVDNCPLKIHGALVNEIAYPNCSLRLLTLDSDLSETRECDLIRLDKEPDEIIREIIKQTYPTIPDISLQKIVQFAQGFPQMALLMGKAYLDEKRDWLRLNEEVFANQLLWGRRPINQSELHILQVCALFNAISWSWDEGAEAKRTRKWIAQLSETSEVEVYARLVDFKIRGILQKADENTLQVVPKPLAIRLACDYLVHTPPSMRQTFVRDLPDNMLFQLAEQFSHLDFLDEAQEILKQLYESEGLLVQRKLLKRHQNPSVRIDSQLGKRKEREDQVTGDEGMSPIVPDDTDTLIPVAKIAKFSATQDVAFAKRIVQHGFLSASAFESPAITAGESAIQREG